MRAAAATAQNELEISKDMASVRRSCSEEAAAAFELAELEFDPLVPRTVLTSLSRPDPTEQRKGCAAKTEPQPARQC